jgi:hypothetical protein
VLRTAEKLAAQRRGEAGSHEPLAAHLRLDSVGVLHDKRDL